MPSYYATRSVSTRARQYEAGDVVVLTTLTEDERQRYQTSGAIVPARFVDTAANLAKQNPIVGAGLVAYATDTGDVRIGDGVTAWSSLPAPLSSTYGPRTPGSKLRRAAAKAYRADSLSLGVMATPPTITSGLSNLDGTLTKSYRTVSDSALGYYRVSGAIATETVASVYTTGWSVSNPGGAGGNTAFDAAHSTWGWAIEWETDAPKVMIRLLNSSLKWMAEVDDQRVSATAQAYPGTSGTGYILLDFTSAGGSAVRKFRFEMCEASAFDGVYVGPTYTIWKPQDENGVIASVVGDSIEAGAGASAEFWAANKWLGKLLGWTDVRQVAFGGTGFVIPGSFNTFGSALRVADVVASAPDVLLVVPSQNDDNQAGLQSAMLATLQAYRTGLPTTPIVVLGADAGSSGPSAARLTTEAAMLAAFNQWGDSRSFFVPCSNAADGSWFTGTGFVGSLSGSGNRDRFGYDSAHPNDLGHQWRAQRLAHALRMLVLPYVV